MSGVVLVPPKFQFLDALGNPLAGGLVDVFLAGTTTRTSSWQDQAQTSLNTNPIVLDSNGSCTMVVDDSIVYKLVVKSAAGVTQPHLGGDNISGVGSNTPIATVADYTALRAYTGNAKCIQVTGYSASAAPSGIAGQFTRDDADTTSTDNGGTIIVASNGKRWKRVLSGNWFDVKWFAAIGDGVADDTAAFTAAIAAMALRKGGMLFVPRGTYKLTSTLDLSFGTTGLTQFALVGEGKNHGQTGVSSQIVGTFDGPLIKYVNPGTGNNFKVADLYFAQGSTGTSAAVLTCQGFVGASVENCEIHSSGAYGINSQVGSNFTLDIRGCVFIGGLPTNPNGIAIFASGHTHISACDIVGWGEGVRACGVTVNIMGCRIEVNKTGLNLGTDAAGASSLLTRSAIIGNSFEANDVGIRVRSMNSSVISGMGVQGSSNAPSGQSQIGVNVQSYSYCTFTGWVVNGTFNNAGVIVEGGTGVSATFENILVQNTFGGSSRVWDVKTGLGTSGNVAFRSTNYALRPDDTAGVSNAQRHCQVQYLAQLDYMNANVEGKNLRGKNVALGSGVTTKAVAFTANGHGAGNAVINTATATAGGSLTSGVTYFYVATAVTAHGECAPSTEKSVTAGAGNNTATLVFFGMTADGFKRRVYRGTQSGVYDGYFELPLNSNSNFVDDGTVAFTGRKSPPTSGVDDTDMREPDANYAVVVTPSWLTTCRVTSKATTGFTVDFGTATPDANQTIDWLLVR